MAARPLESASWLACLSVVVDAGADLAAFDRGGIVALTAATRTHLPGFGTTRVCHRIVRAFFAALNDQGGVAAQRPGALERIGLVLADWRAAQARLSDVESRMVGVLDAMGLTALVTSIPGASTVGAAVILAETGDPSRFASARSVVKHAGLNPVENTSATFRGATRISHRGRPGLRVAAWRAVWAALQHNQVLADRYTRLTTRARDQLKPDRPARPALRRYCGGCMPSSLTARSTTPPSPRARPAPPADRRRSRPDPTPREQRTSQATSLRRKSPTSRRATKLAANHGPPRRPRSSSISRCRERSTIGRQARLIIYVETRDRRRRPPLAGGTQPTKINQPGCRVGRPTIAPSQ